MSEEIPIEEMVGGLPPSAAVQRDLAIAEANKAFTEACRAATAALRVLTERLAERDE